MEKVKRQLQSGENDKEVTVGVPSLMCGFTVTWLGATFIDNVAMKFPCCHEVSTRILLQHKIDDNH